MTTPLSTSPAWAFFVLIIPQKHIFPCVLLWADKPLYFDKESVSRSIGQSDTFCIRRAYGLVRHDPHTGRAVLSANRRRQSGSCRRHDPYTGIMIHPYDTATHKNERGASPVELPSRPKAHKTLNQHLQENNHFTFTENLI